MRNPDTDAIILGLMSKQREIRGKKVFQKVCYFLQEAAGAQMGLRFRMRHYGPYSEELDDRLEDLAERGLLVVDDLGDEGFRISAGANLQKADLSAAPWERIDAVLADLADEMGHGLRLELLATAHFLSTTQPYRGSSEDKEQLIARVQAWKGKKFDAQFISQNIERLKELGYLPTSP